VISFKIARALERLKRTAEAIDRYYTEVVLAYREGRLAGVYYDDAAKAAFSRSAFWLADEYEMRGMPLQAVSVLRLVVASDVPAAKEAQRRIERISMKGRNL
jgi:predicted GNAT superfamily acetyltransferase